MALRSTAIRTVRRPVIFLFLRSERVYFVAMKALQIEYPESWPAAAGSSAERFEDEARMALAMKLYEMGRLTSGQAAQLAGVSRVAFLLNCPQWNVPTVAWDSSELASEFKPFPA
jgi:predicted HTH domain antitoxin